jgi:hypothetical protein
MARVLSVQLNDAALQSLGLQPVTLPGGITAGLEGIIRSGIVRRGQVLAWADTPASAKDAPRRPGDLTGWECDHSSFHIEDHVPVDIASIDDAPVISEAGQRTLLTQGLNFSMRFASLVRGLPEPSAVRCIVGANETNATFRFHQIRLGQTWHRPDLDDYKLDKMIVIDVKPAALNQPLRVRCPSLNWGQIPFVTSVADGPYRRATEGARLAVETCARLQDPQAG